MALDLSALASLDEDDLKSWSEDDVAYVLWQTKWAMTARPNQLPPAIDWTEAGFMAGRGFGKALALDTPIATTAGWTTMGEIHDGDEIFDENGHPCVVEKAHDVLLGRDCYRVVFDDGSKIVADGEHLWATLSRADRRAKRPAKVRTTNEIRGSLRVSGERNHAIPVAGPLDLANIDDLPIEPYLLGLWLGDGSSAGASITTADPEIVNAFEREGYTMRPWATENCGLAKIYGIVSGIRGSRDPETGRYLGGGFPEQLRELDLVNNKHVPKIYLRTSASQRLALLQGLVDSDGHVNRSTGNVEFCSINQRIAHGTWELALSLGLKARMYEDRARLNGVDKGARYRVCWQADVSTPPARLPRKLSALQPKCAPASSRRYITAVEPVPSVPVRCITVDSHSSLYLAGRNLIPTHNTRVGAEWLAAASYEDPDAFPSAVIAPTYGDVKFTCFEGPAGLLNVMPKELLIRYNSSDMIIEMKTRSGKTTTIRGFTAEKPERLRGPQHARIWGDELSSWQYDEDTWDMALMGLRLGNNPQILWTTTPKPKELIRKLTEPKKGRFIVRGSTFDNKANLPDSFFAQLEQYEGTTLGRQELYGELIDPEESGIIKRSWFRLWPAKKPLPNFDWIIMSMDTAFTEATFDKKNGADSSACVVIGVFMHEEVANLIVLDCWSEQLGLPELIKRVKRELSNRYGDDEDTAVIRPMFGSAKPMTSGRAPDILLIEDKGSGISLRQMLMREGIEAYAYNPGRADKLTRLHIVSPVFAQKRVWLPESDKFKGRPKTWIEPMLAQLCAFTGAGSIKHDDYVDSMAQAVRLCMDKGMVSTVKASEEKRRNADEVDRRSAPREYQNPYAA